MSGIEDAIADENTRRIEKPSVSIKQAQTLVEQTFKIPVGAEEGDIKSLDSYDDRNFRVKAQNGQVYTLKVHNGVETRKYQPFLDAQNKVLVHLKAKGLTVPVPQKNAEGQYFPLIEYIASEEAATTTTTEAKAEAQEEEAKTTQQLTHVVRLLAWVHGTQLSEVKDCTLETICNTGRYLAGLDEALASFQHPAVVRVHMWDLQNFAFIERFFSTIPDSVKRTQIQEILEAFQTQVAPILAAQSNVVTDEKRVRKGVIMGDFNDGNIIMQAPNVTTGHAEVAGVIDFGDMVESYYVSELAIGMAYTLVGPYGKQHVFDPTKDYGDELPGGLQAAVAFYQGYTATRPLLPTERSILTTLLRCRLALSTTLGAYSISLQPWNTYLSLHAKPGWLAVDMLQRYDGKYLNALETALDAVDTAAVAEAV